MNAQSEVVVKKSRSSVKWSFFGEIFAKLATPISSMVLARLLAPEVFGIVASITIITSFCEIISESGFAKLIIQKDFDDENTYRKYFSVAFYTNIVIALVMMAVVCIAAYPLSNLVGCKGYENILMFSSLQIPFQSMGALYISDLRRDFKFKQIFYLRIIYCLIPFIVTIPMALLGLEYWSLAVGMVASAFIQLVILLIVSKNKLKLFYSFKVFKDMFKLSFAMLIEATVIWLCSWASLFVVTQLYSAHDVGILKVSKSTINSIFIIVSSALTPILFASLSRLKSDNNTYKNTFYELQSLCLLLVIPMGLGCFVYSDVVVDIFLGKQWSDATNVIALFGISQPLIIAYSFFLSEVFRSKGHIYTSIIYQIGIFISQMVLYFTLGRIGFIWIVISSFIINVIMTIAAILLLKLKYKFSILKQLKAMIPGIVCSLFMVPFMVLESTKTYSFISELVCIIVCISAFFLSLRLIYPSYAKKTWQLFSFKR